MVNSDSKYHTEFETVDHTITGKMVVCSFEIPEIEFVKLTSNDKDYIRQSVATQIAKVLIDNSMIEYTQMSNPTTFNKVIKGRVFVTPDTQTRLVRTISKK